MAAHPRLRPDVIQLDAAGEPRVVASGIGGSARDLMGLTWADSLWTLEWDLGYGVFYALPVLGDDAGDYGLIWQTLDPLGPNGDLRALVMADAQDGGVGMPDTIAIVPMLSSVRYAGASRGSRRWAVKPDFSELHLWRSEAPGEWTELVIPAVGADGIAMGAVDDTTVLVVFQWSHVGAGTRWGYMRGTVWEEGAPPITPDPGGLAVRMRENADGGFWAGWGNKRAYVETARYSNGAWALVDTIRCAYARAEQYLSDWTDVSRDQYPYPAIAWSAFSTNTGVETICACVPTDNGFTVADNLADSDEGGNPVIARDRNGDAWVAWATFTEGMFFAHTFTIAETSTPTLSTTATDRTVHWTLSELAPETWWAVLASRDGGPYQQVGRVRAADALAMSWTDTSPPAEEIRYRIRRECVDTRYQWLSGEAAWDGTTATELALASAEAEPDRVVLIWQGAGAGALAAQVERRGAAGVWEQIGDAESLSADRLRYEDDTVTPGERYGYRLTWLEGGAAQHTAESTVEVPLRPVLTLEGFTPNPSVREAVVAFTLPAAGRGRLEVLDVAGRRVFRRDLSDLGAGRHTLAIEPAQRLRAGVYLIRLTHDEQVLHARGVITR